MDLRCPCGNKLGKVVAGHLVVRHRGRTVVCPLSLSPTLSLEHLVVIECEDCGRVCTLAGPGEQEAGRSRDGLGTFPRPEGPGGAGGPEGPEGPEGRGGGA